MITERRLIRQLHKGDTAAWQCVYIQCKHDLVTLAHVLLCRKSAAEDVVHDVFAKLLDGAGRLRIRGNLRSYLLTAVANTARNRNREPWVAGSSTCGGRLVVEAPDRLVAENEQQERLLRALEKLPYEQREVILLRHYADLRFRAIAKQLGISINTAQGRYRYGLQKLRSLLQGDL